MNRELAHTSNIKKKSMPAGLAHVEIAPDEQDHFREDGGDDFRNDQFDDLEVEMQEIDGEENLDGEEFDDEIPDEEMVDVPDVMDMDIAVDEVNDGNDAVNLDYGDVM